MNAHALAIALHLVAAVIWVGGMFFAHQILRPVAAAQLEPPRRLPLWTGVFSRFFPWVWVIVILLPATGYWMIFNRFGGMSAVGLYVHLMQGLGWLMILLYLHLFFAPWRKLREAVATQNWPEAGAQLNRIRRVVGINLLLGLGVILIAAGGRYFY
ncbi:MAG TPA: hypothetical protein ENJ79_07125 [Gammaproteobacteria bacterium]|nr:hypothetical protein [Gammaproteobacteria bacterium]